jgi:hypothetical protein
VRGFSLSKSSLPASELTNPNRTFRLTVSQIALSHCRAVINSFNISSRQFVTCA